MAKDDKKQEGDPGPEIVRAPDPWQVMAQIAAAMEALAKRQQEAPNDRVAEIIGVLGPALERMSENQLAGSKLIAEETRRAHRPSNEIIPNVSVFNRRGTQLADYQKPPLKCLMMLPWIAEWESLTREEVELLNLLEPGEYVVKRIDNSKVRVEVKVDYKVDNVTPSRLVMNHETAFNNDNFRLAPALSDMLRQILKQHPRDVARRAAAVMSDEEEQMLIEAGELSVSV